MFTGGATLLCLTAGVWLGGVREAQTVVASGALPGSDDPPGLGEGFSRRAGALRLRESFPVLSAICFLSMSWQYNAQWLTRGLLVAAGLSLLARAGLPTRRAL